jgi:hypothetical protein
MPTLPTPRYTPLNPPLCQNPLVDWTRVLIVSSGKNMKSTASPDIAPDYLVSSDQAWSIVTRQKSPLRCRRVPGETGVDIGVSHFGNFR